MHRFTKLSVRSDFCFLIALSIFVLPIQWVFGWIAAALLHELCHILMMLILKITILSISIRASGMIITSDSMTLSQELLCTLAGPFGGLTALLFIKAFPPIGVSAAVQTAYNLLPVYPLDGGRAIKCALAYFVGERKAKSLSNMINIVSLFIVMIIGIYIYRNNFAVILLLLLLMCRLVHKNFLQCRQNNSTIT